MGKTPSRRATKKRERERKKDDDDNGANDGQLWVCEFCGENNDVNVDPEEVPTKETRDYILEPGKQQGKGKDNDGLVIFVIDVSGSMCVTSEIPGTVKLRGGFDPSKFDIPELDGRPVPMRQQKKVTYVSRLQCVQATIDSQLEHWAKEHPEKRVGLITFGDEVVIFGDGTTDPITIAGDKLNNQNQLQEAGKKGLVNAGVAKARAALSERLWGLQENGRTALGPALLTAVAMAGEVQGAKVVVCTDGLANVGLGALDGITNDGDKEQIEKWYESIGNLGKLQGVTVDVISIKGSECALEDLGKVAEITGGVVTRMDPLELTKNLSSILANPIRATQVSATFILHEGLKFRNEPDVVGNKLVRELGNVTDDTEITFEYDVGDVSKFRKLKSLPFQVQLRYTKLDGMRCLRVLSKSQEITKNRQQAEEDVKIELLAANVAHRAAQFAQHGQFTKARENNLRYGKMLQRAAKTEDQKSAYNAWVSDMDNFDSSMHRQEEQVKSVMSRPSSAQMRQLAPAMDRRGAASDSLQVEEGADARVKSRVSKMLRNDAQYQEVHNMKAKASHAYKKK